MSYSMLTPPSTLNGIKDLAKRIKVAQGITHHEALNVAARASGYQNFNHALNKIDQGPMPSKMVYITSYWKDHESKEKGRITIGFPLSRPFGDFLTPSQVRYSNRYTGGFKLEFTDHLEKVNDSSLAEVHYDLHAAARTIQFMERTGLRKASHGFPKDIEKILGFGHMKGSDHMSWWSVPGNPDKWVVLDEPYNFYEREAWAAEHGISAVKAWRLGLYLGGDTYTTIFTGSEAYSKEILRYLSEISLNDKNFVNAEAPYDSVFVSPARTSANKRRKPRPAPVSSGTVRGNSISMGGSAGENTRWRPLTPLPLDKHLEIGPILQAVYDSGVPYQAKYQLLGVMTSLCNWFFREHKEKITEEIEYAYNGTGENSPSFKIMNTLTDRKSKVEAIEMVRLILAYGYPDCPPLHKVIRNLYLVSEHLRKSS